VLGSQYACADGSLSTGSNSPMAFANQTTWASNLIDPSSITTSEEQVMILGEDAMPLNVQRLSSSSPLFPHR
jgi:hypothetical protein